MTTKTKWILGTVALVCTTVAHSAEYRCEAGQITEACLAGAINQANANPDHDVIVLGAGTFRLTRSLPAVTTPIAIVGMGGGTTFIHGSCPDTQRDPKTGCGGVWEFSVLSVESSGSLELDAVCVRNGMSDQGGGIMNRGSLAIRRSTIAKNFAWNFGGGISHRGEKLTITDSTITGNAARDTMIGGAVFIDGGRVSIGHSTINSNVAGMAGGIYLHGGELLMDETTISGNRANGPPWLGSNAGGVVNHHGVIWTRNVTVTANVGPVTPSQKGNSFAGGVFNSGQLHLTNTIIAVNKRNSSPSDLGCSGRATFSYGGNLVGAFTGGSTCKLEKPSWNPNWPARKADKVVTNYFSIFEGADRPLLKDNGGTSCTHALKAGSPALDMAWTGRPGEHPFACAQFDQRWAERPSTWTGTGCDAGAFERTGQVQPSGLGCR